MAISRRLRYETLRRDGHACRYCGTKAPEVALTVDHVIPVALGGGDEPSNLVTACRDCNAGKSASSPDAAIIEDVASDALRWAAAMRYASELLEERADELRRRAQLFREDWDRWTFGGEPAPLPSDWQGSVIVIFKAGLSNERMAEAIDSTMAARGVLLNNRFRYFCGACWRMLREQQDIARALIEEDDG